MQIQNILGNTINSFKLTKRSFLKTALNSEQSYELQSSDEDKSLNLLERKLTNNFIEYLDRHLTMSLVIVFWFSKIEILRKLAKKRDFRKFLDPIWGFIPKRSPTIREFHISWFPFGTKNHEMREPPVAGYLKCTKGIWKFEKPHTGT